MIGETTTLYREIDSLGGTYNSDFLRGYVHAIDDVLAILARRGFTEQADATPPMYDDAMALIHEMACASHTSTYIDHYDEARRIHDAVTPVDPDLVEARKMAAVAHPNSSTANFLDGEADGASSVQWRLEGIKRGRELAAR